LSGQLLTGIEERNYNRQKLILKRNALTCDSSEYPELFMTNDAQSHSAVVALRERVKELTCLYGISQIAGQPDISLKEILQGIVELLPPAWQYPEITSARIIFDGDPYTSPVFHNGNYRQTADIIVAGVSRGTIEMVYAEEMPQADEGPFLKEERNLINAVAKQIAMIIERKEAEEDKLKLHAQLRHADRLATIGMLAAGVAHELNEPLGNILGFAQLSKKCPGIPASAKSDIDKIESASLQAREIIKKLLVFARQRPPKKTLINLNQVVQDSFYFFSARCAKEGIELVQALSPNLPKIVADPALLNQVLVNLVVNASQSMSGAGGGTITVKTRTDKHNIYLTVEDTGPGISKDILEKIFVPFFTTKDVGEGTGLGLPVVHGIVTSHGGTIDVDSRVGYGTRFEIRLPVDTGQEQEENF
jgi:two-component system NtrC family sensor kinase